MRRMIEHNAPNKVYSELDEMPFNDGTGSVDFNLHEGDSIVIMPAAIKNMILIEAEVQTSIPINFITPNGVGKTFIVGPCLQFQLNNTGKFLDEIFDAYSTYNGDITIIPDNWLTDQGIRVCYRGGITYIDIVEEL